MFRCGNGGEVFILWNSLQSNNIFDWATRTVHGDCSGERECVVWDRAVAAFIGCIYRRFFSWSLPHHSYCYSYLHPGTSPSVSISLHFLFLLMMWSPFLLCLIIYGFNYSRLGWGVPGWMSSFCLILFSSCINLFHIILSHHILHLLQFFLIYKICFININILKITLNLLHQIKLISSKD